ncbi:MAG: NUDIX hydrolase [Caldilineaceae bacterium]|nr:NUDIX hydrolase [Caldilineaceae bacterium]
MTIMDKQIIPDPPHWQTLTTRREFQNRWLTVATDEVALPTGRRYEYTRLEPPGIGVGVIGFNNEGQVLLEREYRHGVKEVIWQLPGGLASAGEDLQTAGLRELLEETGYAPAKVNAETVRYLGVVWDNPAFGTAQSHAYAAWNLQPTATPRRDAEEFVTLHWVSTDWLKEAVRDGEIRDRFVVAAVAHLLLNDLI